MRDYHIGASSLPARALGGLAALLAAAAIVFAGATREGELLNAGVRLLALLVLLLAAFRLSRIDLRTEWRRPLILAAAIAALPLIQLIPLPPLIWTHLPGRGEIVALYDAAGMPPPWHGLGLNPEGSLNAALALLPGLAMFLAIITVETRGRVFTALVAVAFALAGTLLGLVQVAEGPESALRFYDTTNPSSAVGFFSNRNHQASLQLVAMPLVTAVLAATFPNRRGWPSVPAMVIAAALLALLAVTTVLTDSRAGMVLYPPVVAACALILLRDRIPKLSGRVVLITLGGLIVFGGLLAGGALMSRPELVAELASDPRMAGLPTVSAEALRQLPFGAGLGAFDEIYRSRETIEGMQSAYLNHAHNDLLELWLEAGLPGLVLVGLFVVWFGRRSWDAWRTPGMDGVLACAGSIIVGALLLHSLVDYPLRTGAMSAMLGLGCGLLLPHPGQKAVVAAPAEDRPRIAGPSRRQALPGGTRVASWRPRRR
ncbi:MAG: O-antigen ligase family protein [Caulobacter sp.]|nr:O-antigen ligase family protein [Caulobacter sp.]